MKLKPIQRKKQKLRLALQGDTNTGKTLSALLLAYGITGDWTKIAIVDTEQNSASFYSNLGTFNTLQISAPFKVNKYVDAIDLCEASGMEVIILDSITPEWLGEGGVMDVYCATSGSNADRWDAAIPNHHVFISYLTHSTAHIIATVRATPNKVWQQEGYTHYFTTVLTLNKQYEASLIKDRTGLFKGMCPVKLSPDVGAKLFQWSNEGDEVVSPELQQKIDSCTSHQQLHQLLVASDIEDTGIITAFTKRRLELEGISLNVVYKA